MSIINVQSLKVPIDAAPPFEYVVAKQGDILSRKVEITLTENNVEYEIPSGTKARVNYYKPDGNKVVNNCDIVNNKVIMTYTQQMLAAAGTGFSEIQLYNDESVLISATFYTKIAESANCDIKSTDESTSLEQLIIETEQARDSTQAAIAAAEKATDNANNAAKAAKDAAAAVYTDRNYNLLVDDNGKITFMYDDKEE